MENDNRQFMDKSNARDGKQIPLSFFICTYAFICDYTFQRTMKQ